MKLARLFLVVVLFSMARACHFRLDYMAACRNGNTKEVDFTFKVANQTPACNTDFCDEQDLNIGDGDGLHQISCKSGTLDKYRINYPTTSSYTFGSETVTIHASGGNPSHIYTANGVVTATFELNARSALSNDKTPFDTSAVMTATASIDFTTPSGQCTPAVASPDVLYFPLNYNIQNFDFGAFDPNGDSISCTDQTVNDPDNDLNAIACNGNTLNLQTNCTISWNTIGCAANSYILRTGIADSYGNQMVYETTVILVNAQLPSCAAVDPALAASTAASPFVVLCPYPNCVDTNYNMQATNPNTGDNLDIVSSTYAINPSAGTNNQASPLTVSVTVPLSSAASLYTETATFRDTTYRFLTSCSFYISKVISDRFVIQLYHDDSRNGIRDVGEAGYPNIQVFALQYDCTNPNSVTPKGSCTTDPTGQCNIDLPPVSSSVCYIFSYTLPTLMTTSPIAADNVFANNAGTATYQYTTPSSGGASHTISGGLMVVCQVTMGLSTTTPESCSVAHDGTINVQATCLAGACSYKIKSSTGVVTGPQASQLFSGLAAGTYTITVNDTPSCTGTASATVAPNGSTLSATISSTGIATTKPGCGDVSCDVNDGALRASPSGGVAPYQYLWNTGSVSQSISSLGPGTYSVTVTDLLGCTFAPASKTLTRVGSDSFSASNRANMYLPWTINWSFTQCAAAPVSSIDLDLVDAQTGTVVKRINNAPLSASAGVYIWRPFGVYPQKYKLMKSNNGATGCASPNALPVTIKTRPDPT